jgi:hypothetical protein
VLSSLQVATPVIEAIKEPAGVFLSASCSTPGAVIRYTTDGSQPTVDSPRYEGRIPASFDGPAFFVGFADGYLPGDTGRWGNPVILSQKLAANRVELSVWFPAQGRHVIQDSLDLMAWRSFEDRTSDWNTNAVFNYPYSPTNPAAVRFFRTAPSLLRGPSGDVP